MIVVEKYNGLVVELNDHLERVGDIINIEGPVLSLFKDNRNMNLYLFDWDDSDEITNRWLVYKINPEILNVFLTRKISYKMMFESCLLNDFYYADVVNSEDIYYSIQKVKSLPKDYFATKDVFLDIEDTKNFAEINKVVNHILSVNKKFNMVNRIYYDSPFIFPQQPTDEIPPNDFTIVISVDTSNESTKLDEQHYASTSNRVPNSKRMGLLC